MGFPGILQKLFSGGGKGGKLRPEIVPDIEPRGVVKMWYGEASAVPEGWAICDGTQGTPDLRDSFIIGAGGKYALDARGGAASATPDVSTGTAKTGIGIQGTTLDWNPLPSHTHQTPSDRSEGSDTSLNDSGSGHPPDGYATSTAAGNSWGHAHGVSDPGHAHAVGSSEHAHGVSDPTHGHTVATEAHNHTLTDGGHAHTVTAKAISTLPPYCALHFIMKL